jgi:hypothetical protein
MAKGQRAGSSAIKIQVKEGKFYFLTFGVVVGKVLNNHFEIALIKDLDLNLLYIKQKQLKRCFFALVNNLITSRFVTANTIKSNIANFCFLTIKFQYEKY